MHKGALLSSKMVRWGSGRWSWELTWSCSSISGKLMLATDVAWPWAYTHTTAIESKRATRRGLKNDIVDGKNGCWEERKERGTVELWRRDYQIISMLRYRMAFSEVESIFSKPAGSLGPEGLVNWLSKISALWCQASSLLNSLQDFKGVRVDSNYLEISCICSLLIGKTLFYGRYEYSIDKKDDGSPIVSQPFPAK